MKGINIDDIIDNYHDHVWQIYFFYAVKKEGYIRKFTLAELIKQFERAGKNKCGHGKSGEPCDRIEHDRQHTPLRKNINSLGEKMY